MSLGKTLIVENPISQADGDIRYALSGTGGAAGPPGPVPSGDLSLQQLSLLGVTNGYGPGSTPVTLNDFSLSGTWVLNRYSFWSPGFPDNGIFVWIDAIGNPDTFGWSTRIDAEHADGVPMTGDYQQLGNTGLYVKFNATTGHGLFDEWDTDISLILPLKIKDVAGNVGIEVFGNGDVNLSGLLSVSGLVVKNIPNGQHLVMDNGVVSGMDIDSDSVGTGRFVKEFAPDISGAALLGARFTGNSRFEGGWTDVDAPFDFNTGVGIDNGVYGNLRIKSLGNLSFTPDVTPQTPGGGKTYSYQIVPNSNDGSYGKASNVGTTVDGADDLSSNPIRISWQRVAGAFGGYSIYRVATDGSVTNTSGFVNSVSEGITSFTDLGDVANGVMPPTEGTDGNTYVDKQIFESGVALVDKYKPNISGINGTFSALSTFTIVSGIIVAAV